MGAGRATDMDGYQVVFRAEEGILYVHLSGKIPDDLFRKKENVFQPLIEALSGYACTRALIDARDLQADLTTMALFRAGEDAASVTRLGLRFALVAREDMQDAFFGTVASNRGAHLGIFTDGDAAREWLLQQ